MDFKTYFSTRQKEAIIVFAATFVLFTVVRATFTGSNDPGCDSRSSIQCRNMAQNNDKPPATMGNSALDTCPAYLSNTRSNDNTPESHDPPTSRCPNTKHLDISAFGPQGHLGYIDAEEAALPKRSFHDAYGKLVDEEEYNRLCDLEVEHERNGTLHLLYPDLYPKPEG